MLTILSFFVFMPAFHLIIFYKGGEEVKEVKELRRSKEMGSMEMQNCYFVCFFFGGLEVFPYLCTPLQAIRGRKDG